MRRLLFLAGLVFGFAVGLHAQVVDTAVCAVVKDPASFNGKMVRIKGTVVAGFDEFVIKDAKDPNCGFPVNAIWLSYPQGTKGKAGPAALLVIQPAKNFAGKFAPPTRTPVALQKDKDFKQFDSLLAQQRQKGAAMCLGCTRYEVTATLVGRLDSVADATLKIDDGKITGLGGFGNMNAYPARLMLQSVTDVTPREIDFSKIDAATKSDQMQMPGSSDLNSTITGAQKFAASLAASPTKDVMVKAAEVYGKPGEHTGVNTSNGNPNEASAKDEGLGTMDSPDGLLFNCIFNSDHLQGDALTKAVFHMGKHIVDLQNSVAGDGGAAAYILEYNAWVVTTISAVTSGQKYLTLPGGYLMWDSTWPPADRNDKMDATLKDFLANEAQLSR
jgi:hypothetical protein